jgi:hypothetical protein
MLQILTKQKYTRSAAQGAKGLLDVSANRLAEGLGATIATPKIKLRKKTNLVINYGLTNLGINTYTSIPIINTPLAVALSSNKLSTFRTLSHLAIPLYFTTISEARSFLAHNPKSKIVCRTLLNSTNGKGIIIATTPEELVECNLYTVYFPKKWELRFHVVFNAVIRTQQKRRSSTEQLEERGIIERNKYIRNIDNGYIYSSSLDSHLSPEFIEGVGLHCIEAVRALQLDFGAVDIIVNKDLEYSLLEVNSAPGLQGSTLTAYINKFKEVLVK